MQNATTVVDAQPRAIAGWSLESPVSRKVHAGFGRGVSEKGLARGTSPAPYLNGLEPQGLS